MRRLVLLAGFALLATVLAPLPVSAESSSDASQTMRDAVTVEGIREHQAAFQAAADANGGVRSASTPGYDASADYVQDQLEAAGYDVQRIEFPFDFFEQVGDAALEQTAPNPTVYVDQTDFDVMEYSGSGTPSAAVTSVDLALTDRDNSTSGCEPEDFAGFTAGTIALMQRGACSFAQKAANAEAAGAAGAIIFNQGNTPGREGLIGVTLGEDYSGGIPVVFATYGLGEEWAGTDGLQMTIGANANTETRETYNVFAETSGGREDTTIMVGAHLDSVPEGPGVQDNGTGLAAILETAVQMRKVNPRNKVRFAWWGAEEFGLLGSDYYITDLFFNDPEGLDDIALYLNFDMIGSPNYFFGIYDGDDSDAVGAGPGPEGSAQIEAMFEEYFNLVGEPFQGTDFSGRSDYGPFIAVGIPAGGLFTGAEGIKTDAEVALYGGTAGDQYDPCYHLACDTFDNVSLFALEVNSDAVAYATLNYAMSTELINGGVSKGNFKPGRHTHHHNPGDWLADAD